MRLIDADTIFEKIKEMERQPLSEDVVSEICKVLCEIADALAVDAVPVVRCKDCVHYNRVNSECCRLLNEPFCGTFWMKMNDFCSYGKRKDGTE